MNTASPENAGVFDAFISYSRKDKAFAEALATALNHFKPPKLAGVASKQLKVFRDESDLIGADYYESIGENLRRSRKFILVCSPSAAQSEFVDDEIKRFLESGQKRNIIPIILDGLPNNEASPDREDEMAFPPALCEALQLPLAISFLGFNPKKEKVQKGKYEGSWYSVVASILDVSRDELEERDRKRQQRRRNIISSIALVVIAILSALTVFAFLQKTEAEKQQAIAVERRDEALTTQSRFLASLAELQNRRGRYELGTLLSLEAAPRSMKKPDRPYVQEVAPPLYDAVVHNRLRWTSDSKKLAEERLGIRRTEDGRASPDGRWQLVSGDKLILEDREGNTEPVVLAAEGNDVIFGPDGSWMMVVGSQASGPQLWSLAGDEAPREIAPNTSGPHMDPQCPKGKDIRNGLTDMLPDGTRLSVCSGVARIWAPGRTPPFIELPQEDGLFLWARFSPDRRHVLTVSEEPVRTQVAVTYTPIVRQWALDNDAAPVRWTVDDETGSVPLFAASSEEASLDGGWRLVAEGDHEARVFQLSKTGSDAGHVIFPPPGDASGGNLTASWDQGGTEVKVKDESGRVVASLRHQMPVMGATLMSGGTRLQTVSGNLAGMMSSLNGHLWNVEQGTLLADYALNSLRADMVSSPDGKLFLILPDKGSDAVPQVRSALDGAVIANLPHPDVGDFRFSHDGQHVLVLGFEDFDASVWRLFGPQELIDRGCSMLRIRLDPDQRRQFFLPERSKPGICGDQ